MLAGASSIISSFVCFATGDNGARILEDACGSGVFCSFCLWGGKVIRDVCSGAALFYFF